MYWGGRCHAGGYDELFIALCGQPPGTQWSLFASQSSPRRRVPKSKFPTSTNLLLHILRAHLQVMLWKGADQHAPPDESADIIQFGWWDPGWRSHSYYCSVRPRPPYPYDVIPSECSAQGKKCSIEVCCCHKEYLSCTSYCNYSGEDVCCNQ